MYHRYFLRYTLLLLSCNFGRFGAHATPLDAMHFFSNKEVRFYSKSFQKKLPRAIYLAVFFNAFLPNDLIALVSSPQKVKDTFFFMRATLLLFLSERIICKLLMHISWKEYAFFFALLEGISYLHKLNMLIHQGISFSEQFKMVPYLPIMVFFNENSLFFERILKKKTWPEAGQERTLRDQIISSKNRIDNWLIKKEVNTDTPTQLTDACCAFKKSTKSYLDLAETKALTDVEKAELANRLHSLSYAMWYYGSISGWLAAGLAKLIWQILLLYVWKKGRGQSIGLVALMIVLLNLELFHPNFFNRNIMFRKLGFFEAFLSALLPNALYFFTLPLAFYVSCNKTIGWWGLLTISGVCTLFNLASFFQEHGNHAQFDETKRAKISLEQPLVAGVLFFIANTVCWLIFTKINCNKGGSPLQSIPLRAFCY